MTFSEKLKSWQSEMDISQKQLSAILFSVPSRTIQSWILGEKEPPLYIQKLIEFRIQSHLKK